MPLLKPLLPGQRVASFELIECLEEGAIASTWRASHTQRPGRFLLHTIPLAALDDPDTEDHLLEQAQQAMTIQSSGVARVLDTGREAGVIFVAHEWIDGGELDGWLRQVPERGLLPRNVTLRLFQQLVDALAELHRAGAVHQAIAPENIRITHEGQAVVLGLGVGLLRRSSSATTFRHMVGKFSYLSPEHLWSRPVEQPSDVFSLGMIVFEMLTGQHPFRGRNDRDTTARILAPEEAPLLSSLGGGFPEGLDACFARMLAKDPTSRFPSAVALQEALRPVLQQTPLASAADVVELLPVWGGMKPLPGPTPSSQLPETPSAPLSGLATQQLPALPVSPPSWPRWVLAAALLVSLVVAGLLALR
ncbi:MAG: serine/threonine protein kinase [Polyangiaceae bacterium]|jgi:serine/threonine-protein kinase|nr:serine/threonine protein kinase [Polyangiaceae bacterium]